MRRTFTFLAQLGILSSVVLESGAASAAPPVAAPAPALSAASVPGQQAASPLVAEQRSLTLEGARQVIAAAIRAAREANTTGAIAVVDAGSNLVALERIDGTAAAAASLSLGKARTAALFQKPTRVFEDSSASGRAAMTALPDFTPVRGGVPLVVGGQVVGAVGVSGAASAERDEQLALAGAAVLAPGAAVVPTTTAERPAMTLFRSDRVQAAFAAGRPLLESQTFKILASRRDGPGKVEIHALDTDIAFIREGSATLVTGGSVRDAKTIEPNEIRGQSSSGGQTQQVSAGDVVVIPKGLPHWFESVRPPFTYYVVKVH